MKTGGRMKKKRIVVTVVLVFALFLIVYPLIELDTGTKLIRCSYTGDFSEYEKNQSYHELYCYYEKKDVSIRSFDVKNFLFFHTITMEYIKGDFRETQFLLPEAYVEKFLKEAKIIENPKNIQLAALIQGKEAIVGNKRYLGNDYENVIFYKLDGKYEEMYVFYIDELLVVQVGSPDELPKYIAYK